jgi:hypothetical protein
VPFTLPAPRWFALGVAACTVAAGAFLIVQLTGWPPHEDETLALFVGRGSLGNLFDVVLGKRGGAPLHFLLAWTVTHLGGGLTALRACSALFAIASIPLVAALGVRLAGRGPALVATAVASASWLLLFHGVYARMYSLFLFLSALSYFALLRALDRGGARRWLLWAVVTLLAIASHQYGALVLASQGLFVLVRRERLREAALAGAAVLVLAIPFWRSSLVLADRFDVGVGGGGSRLGSPGSVLEYLWRVAADASAGYRPVLIPVLLVALYGLWRLPRRSAMLALCVVATPMVFLLIGRFGGSSSPESRHLIFALPFFALAFGAGLVALARRPWLVVLVLAALVPAEVAWGVDRTPALYERERAGRVDARHAAAAWLVRTTQPDDVLFGYEPLYLAAWERARGSFTGTVVPRADPKLALEALEDATRLGRGVFVFDAGDTNNSERVLTIERRLPFPHSDFEARVFGPFLILRTTRPTGTPAQFLDDARKVQLIGKSLDIGDADVNYVTIRRAVAQLARARPSP